MRDKNGCFVKGSSSENRMKVGTVVTRTRHKRSGLRRKYVKIAHPNKWILLARHVWEKHNGKIPKNFGIHHKDGNTLNDNIKNLVCVSKAEHLSIHRHEFATKARISFTKTRRELKWSTKSKTKRTGRPPSWNPEQMEKALIACQQDKKGRTITAIAIEYNIKPSALLRKLRLM